MPKSLQISPAAKSDLVRGNRRLFHHGILTTVILGVPGGILARNWGNDLLLGAISPEALAEFGSSDAVPERSFAHAAALVMKLSVDAGIGMGVAGTSLLLLHTVGFVRWLADDIRSEATLRIEHGKQIEHHPQ